MQDRPDPDALLQRIQQQQAQQQRGVGHNLVKEHGKDVVENLHNTLQKVDALNARYAQVGCCDHSNNQK